MSVRADFFVRGDPFGQSREIMFESDETHEAERQLDVHLRVDVLVLFKLARLIIELIDDVKELLPQLGMEFLLSNNDLLHIESKQLIGV